jgi:hypothetical protein
MRGVCHVKYLGQIGKLPFGKLPRRNPNTLEFTGSLSGFPVKSVLTTIVFTDSDSLAHLNYDDTVDEADGSRDG